MGLSTATLPSLHVPRLHQDFYPLVCGAALLIHTCRTARPYTHGIHPGRSHQLGIRTQAQAFKSKRLVAQANRVPLAPVIKGRPTQVQSAAAICASAFNVSCGATATQTLTRESSRTSTISDPRKESVPELDHGGSGFGGIRVKPTPYYRGDNGGGGGRPPPTSREFPWGDYWFLIFLFLLHFILREALGMSKHKYKDGRNKPLRLFV